MRGIDPFSVREEKPRDAIVFAAAQRTGNLSRQDDYFINFNDECFVLADGVGELTNGGMAAKLACETAIWGYKHIRQRRFYWHDKKLLVTRIFRSTNLSVYQKSREKGLEGTLGTTLTVAIVGPKNIWIGNTGDSSAFLYREGLIEKLTHDDSNALGNLTRAVGIARSPGGPHVTSEPFLVGDSLLLTTDGVTNSVSEEEVRTVLEQMDTTTESLTTAADALLEAAETNSGQDNMTVCIIKRIAINS